MQEVTTLVHCFSCGFSGNAITFLAELEGISPLKARRFIRDRFGDGFREPEVSFWNEIEAQLGKGENPINNLRRNVVLDEEEQVRRSIASPWMSAGVLHAPHPHIEYMLNRGFTKETMVKFGIGYDTISDRISIPIRDIDGNLIGLKGRAYKEDMLPRYKILGGVEYGFEPYEANRALWGIDICDLGLNDLIVCEGELNAMMLRQQGFQNTVGISGKILSAWQSNTIKDNFSVVTLVFDEMIDALNAAEKLESIYVYIVPEHNQDPASNDFEYNEALLDQAMSPLTASLNGIM